MRIDLADPEAPGLTIPQSRQLDNAICNERVLKRMRELLLSELAQPSLRMSRNAGPPSEDSIETVARPASVDEYSPFHHDYLPPLPPEWADGWSVPLPDLPPDADIGWTAWPLRRDVDTARWDLRAGRAGSSAEMLLIPDSTGGSALRLCSPGETADDRRQTLIAAIGLLKVLMFTTKGADSPQAAKALASAHDNLCSPWDPANQGQLVEAWGGGYARGVPIKADALVPLKMTVLANTSMFDDFAMAAASATPSYERYYSSGLRRKSQEESRAHMRRRAGVVVDDGGNQTNLLRFSHSMATPPRELLPKSRLSDTWAWEIDTEEKAMPDGRHQYTLTVTGIGKVQDVVAYGPELIQFLRAFHAAAIRIDPEAETETISIRI